MKRMACDAYKALAAELDRCGIVKFRVAEGARHPRIIYEVSGREWFIPFSDTKKGRRGILNNVALLRRQVAAARSAALPKS